MSSVSASAGWFQWSDSAMDLEMPGAPPELPGDFAPQSANVRTGFDLCDPEFAEKWLLTIVTWMTGVADRSEIDAG
ncbi:hypothetical protein HBB16_17530 [Pseudonocardia sp. MCCB 268]|nr:hypothetical protein [Pseudonocardia cytotoxica]